MKSSVALASVDPRKYLLLTVISILVCLCNEIGVAQGVRRSLLRDLDRAICDHDLTRVNHILEEEDIDLNARDGNGSTPLLESVACHLPSLAQNLVLLGADPNFGGSGQEYPLAQAAFYCDVETLKFLLDHGAHIDATDKDGYTALMEAAANCNNGEAVQVLLSAGSNPNHRSKNGEAPLMIAADNGNEETVTELIAAGSDPAAASDVGETARSLACERQVGRKQTHDRICAVLKTLPTTSRKKTPTLRNGDVSQSKSPVLK